MIIVLKVKRRYRVVGGSSNPTCSGIIPRKTTVVYPTRSGSNILHGLCGACCGDSAVDVHSFDQRPCETRPVLRGRGFVS